MQPQLATTRVTLNRTLFQQGRLAMLIEGEFFRRYLYGPQMLQGTPFKYNLAQIPFAPRTRQRHIVFNSLGLPAYKAGRPDACLGLPDGVRHQGRAAAHHRQVGLARRPQADVRAVAEEQRRRRPAGELRRDHQGRRVRQAAARVAVPPAERAAGAAPRSCPQIYDNKVPVRAGLQQIDQETNQRLAARRRAAALTLAQPALPARRARRSVTYGPTGASRNMA